MSEVFQFQTPQMGASVPSGPTRVPNHASPTTAHPANRQSASQQTRSPTNYLMGQKPNPEFRKARPGPAKRKRISTVPQAAVASSPAGQSVVQAEPPVSRPIAKSTPKAPPKKAQQITSLSTYLLSQETSKFDSAIHQDFLVRAGSGNLNVRALAQWLSHHLALARSLLSLCGTLISKIRLPKVPMSSNHAISRTMDLCITTLSNIRREMSFFESTVTKYKLPVTDEIVNPAVRSLIDLVAASGSPTASLLEGILVLWTIEHCYRCSWAYAASYLPQDNVPLRPPGTEAPRKPPHITALHDLMLPNWTSPAYGKFVDASRSVVDDLANLQTKGDGRGEMLRCESVFLQIANLWGSSWPVVDEAGNMLEENVQAGNGTNGNGAGHEHVSIASDEDAEGRDEDEDVDVVPSGRRNHLDQRVDYQGTGLEAIEAANRAR